MVIQLELISLMYLESVQDLDNFYWSDKTDQYFKDYRSVLTL